MLLQSPYFYSYKHVFVNKLHGNLGSCYFSYLHIITDVAHSKCYQMFTIKISFFLSTHSFHQSHLVLAGRPGSECVLGRTLKI